MKKLSDLEFATMAKQAAAILRSIEAKLDVIDDALASNVGAKQAA